MSASEVHLVVLIHGLWAHLAVAEEELEAAWNGTRIDEDITGPAEDPTVSTQIQKGTENLVIMVAGGIASTLTYDGVDVCASRVAWEVDQKVAELEEDGDRVTKFSVMGYSLGGCTLISTLLCWLGARILSRSGEQLYVIDHYSEQDSRPLLEIMADPRLVFYQGLEHFDRLDVFASGKRRLQELAQTSSAGARSPIPSASGLSIQGLRDAIRRIERNLESDLIESAETPDIFTHIKAPVQPHEVTVKLRLKDAQLRMAMWLNALPLKKHITWWPEIRNAHATIVVRFPAHERGRGLLQVWAKCLLGQTTDYDILIDDSI
ncbi:hypothetical protein CI109_106602 [Kwoniella shandongensis]|uniref:DUF676 domain-containing protein n=1 Tax=Kwoniella shandongensis TaxID=1734106 RepID=A0AAJ8LNR3_9TREE